MIKPNSNVALALESARASLYRDVCRALMTEIAARTGGTFSVNELIEAVLEKNTPYPAEGLPPKERELCERTAAREHTWELATILASIEAIYGGSGSAALTLKRPGADKV